MRFAMRPGAVGEQDYSELCLAVDPEGTAGIAEVANGVGREEASRRGVFGGRVPTEGARTAFRRLALGEKFDRLGREKRVAVWFENGEREAEKVGNIGEETGVTSCSVEQKGMFILNFTLDASLAEEFVLFCWRNLGPEMRVGAIPGSCHSKREKDFAADPGRQLFAKDGFESFAQQDESGVGVFGAGSRFGFYWQLEAASEDSVGGICGVKERNIAG